MSVPHPQNGSLPLFRFRGILVSLHWSWLLVAFYQINRQRGSYDSLTYVVLEYLALFLIVLLHEFGHAFASRSVGGHAENILLWPFGGIAYINAPHRPGAHLWSIAAGPLVNAALVPVLWLITRYALPENSSPDLVNFAVSLQFINLGLLIFNSLPIYPMDGGQILQALLWFKLGYAKALWIASAAGLLGGVALMVAAYYFTREIYTVLLIGFLLLNSWKAFQASRSMLAAQRTVDRAAGPSES